MIKYNKYNIKSLFNIEDLKSKVNALSNLYTTIPFKLKSSILFNILFINKVDI